MSDYISASIEREVRLNARNACEACRFRERRMGTRTVLQLHHMHPREIGGLTTVNNLCLLCPTDHVIAQFFADTMQVWDRQGTVKHVRRIRR